MFKLLNDLRPNKCGFEGREYHIGSVMVWVDNDYNFSEASIKVDGFWLRCPEEQAKTYIQAYRSRNG